VNTEQGSKKEMTPNWQVTATTIICDKVGQEATIMVYKDWSTACAYHKRWGPVRRKAKEGISRALAQFGIGSLERSLRSDCPGPEKCLSIREYRTRLHEEKMALKD
jgi:hypothetical protein